MEVGRDRNLDTLSFSGVRLLDVRLLVLLLDKWGTCMNPSRYNSEGSRQPAQRGPEMDAEERGVVAV